MKLPEFSVNRKVTTAMLAMILVVLGTLAFFQLGLDFFPDIEFPTVSIITVYSGASSEDIENTITKPLEQIVSSVSRVNKVSSITLEGASVITVEFEWGTNLDFAAQDVRDQIGLYRNYIPEDAQDPLVVKFNIGQIPIIFGGVTAHMPVYELKELIEDEVTPRLERIDGVASAQVFSMEVREILVDVDKAALESRNLSLDQIVMALRMENLNLPAGYIEDRHTEFLVRTLGEYKVIDDIRNAVVGATLTGQPLYLKDVAEVKDTMKESRFLARIQGEKGVFYFINKRSGANSVTTAKAVNKELDKIKKTLPPDVTFYPFMDQSELITRVIRRTGNNALYGGILAIFFILVFLGNWRPTITIALAIPLSIITTFIALYLAGYTINLLTLGGLALGIGMLVDNSIVVIENIFRHLEEGEERNTAAKIGASEVAMAIIASTLTTIAVFFPMVFARGITGRLTRGLALSIAFSLLASLFVALTVVPMVASLLFKANSQNRTNTKSKRKFLEKVRDFYQKTLHWSLQRKWWILGSVLILFVLSLFIGRFFLGREFMPSQDQDMLIISVKMPVGTSLEETNRVVTRVENIINQQSEVKTVSAQVGSQAEENPADMAGGMSTTGSHEGLIWIGLKRKSERTLTDIEVMENIRAQLPQLRDVKFEAMNMSQIWTGGAQTPIEIKIFGKDLTTLKNIADTMVKRIRDIEGLRDVTHTMAEGKPEFQIKINREQASQMGLMTSQIASTVQTASLGKVATRFRERNEEIDVRVRFQKESRDSIDDIKNIPLITPSNKMIRLDQVANISQGEGPLRITRENQAREIKVTANIAGRDLGSIVSDIKKKIAEIERELPVGYFVEFGGQYEQMQETFLIMAGAFLLAILLVYMIMASQFESFLHPFIIMFTIPLGLIGVVLALLITGTPVNLPVLIGFILFGGIAVNNGIVMVDYINQLRKRGVDDREAVIRASVVRMRPVLITAFTTILGMLPMAISTSEGAEMRAPMALAVIGGLFAATFLTLFVIPIIYSLLNKISFKGYSPPEG